MQNLRRDLRLLFSSLMFGSAFGMALLTAGILAWWGNPRGVLFVGISYVALVIGVGIAEWLLGEEDDRRDAGENRFEG